MPSEFLPLLRSARRALPPSSPRRQEARARNRRPRRALGAAVRAGRNLSARASPTAARLLSGELTRRADSPLAPLQVLNMGRGACRFGELPALFEQQHPRHGAQQHRQPARTKSPTRRAHASSSEPYYTADRELEVRPAARARGQARHPGGWARLTRASARPPSSWARACVACRCGASRCSPPRRACSRSRRASTRCSGAPSPCSPRSTLRWTTRPVPERPVESRWPSDTVPHIVAAG